MSYKMPLRQRVHYANYRRNRYANDPEFRLRMVNRMRERRGLSPFSNADEIPTWVEANKIKASNRKRNADGTFA